MKKRRLYFKNSRLVIQSEANLRPGKSRTGKPKDIVDTLDLSSIYHIYMSLGAQAACEGQSSSSIAVIGLGGGCLCTFLRKFIPKTSIIGVDIDHEMLKIAKDWFGLQLDEKLSVEINDGIKFLEKCLKEEKKFNAILFDIDSKDTTIGISCPPKEFLSSSVLSTVISCLENSGLFILNLVVRDESLRSIIFDDLKKHFIHIFSYKLTVDLNEIFICSCDSPEEEIRNRLKKSCKRIENFYKKKQMSDDHLMDFIQYLEVKFSL